MFDSVFNFCKLFLVWCFFLVGVSSSFGGGSLPKLGISDGLGVHIQVKDATPEALAKIAESGFKIVRMDFKWDTIETEKGKYNWSRYDEIVSILRQYHLRPLFILGYSNKLYAEVRELSVSGRAARPIAISPSDDLSINAYKNWVVAGVARYETIQPIWEIWNEPDHSTFWTPRVNVGDYLKMAIRTCDGVRREHPNATIVAPGAANLPGVGSGEFLRAIADSSLPRCLDAISVHPYRLDRPPESVNANYQILRNFFQERSTKFIVSEWGYTMESGLKLNERAQAGWLVRMALNNVAQGIAATVWYEWRDQSTDGSLREGNFGIVKNDSTPKIALKAASVMAEQLDGYSFVRTLDFREKGISAMLFRTIDSMPARFKVVVWSTSASDERLLVMPEFATAGGIDFLGERISSSSKVVGGEPKIRVGGEPRYISVVPR